MIKLYKAWSLAGGVACANKPKMANSNLPGGQSPVDAGIPLLQYSSSSVVTGCVDYNGSPVFRSNSGGWKSASFIIAVEVAERFAYYGIANNLITYLTGPLGLSMAVAAENVNAWSGVGSLLPLLGAFVADSFLGRYRTILLSSAIYILGLGLLTLSAMLPSLSTSGCLNINSNTLCSTQNQVVLFFFALYLVAVGQGGHKPCVQAFGADQFDKQDPEESKARSSFFNWWFFGLSAGFLIMIPALFYIQDNLNWVLGFGIPCISMLVALVIFLLGTKTYRYSDKRDEKSPFMRIGRVFVLAAKNWQATSSAMGDEEEEASGTLLHQSSKQFKFLNKALIATDGSKDYGNVCSIGDVEEAKAVLRLVPIWAASLVYAIVFAQSPTFFTKQGETMDRTITPNFSIPAASLQCFSSLGIVLSVPIYDRIFVPLARALTRNPAGITMLQRIGTGILLSAISMVISALVEMQRLKTAREYGLVDKPKAMVPMSVWWLVPQYALLGVSDVFTMVGLQEFFYDQVPDELRSVGLSLYLGIFGVGSFLSSLLVSTIEKATGGNGRDSWFADNLNRAHLDYFYWLLAGLSAVQLAAYLYFAKCYIYNRTSTLRWRLER
ncbi:protein NRT1/ PTR FAMILY 5.10-like [Herrania umbratica]|uniref:Protein NRT1/ PTR FAMILY 5.10-like n=1 Tax=Herrania umbratica TaxID=108875 RepID=A0A6J1AJY4_9ROSI|nr:protein NRT1/ PTR FAMILY 5.10-like [Herrania umbratica]